MKWATTLLVLALHATFTFAQQAVGPASKLAWDPSPSAETVEVRLYCSPTLGAQDPAVDTPVGTVAVPDQEWAIGTALPDGLHYCVATAANSVNTQSAKSNEVFLSMDSSVPEPPVLRITLAWDPENHVTTLMVEVDGDVVVGNGK